MNIVSRWLRRPQQVWARRAIFQIHLWTGLTLGLYVVVLSLTGSVLVYRIELDQLVASPRAALDERAVPMTVEQLRAAAARVYPGWTITGVYEGRYRARAGGAGGRARRPPDPTASITLVRDGIKKDRLFNPYTGADLGDNFTRGQHAVLWLVQLHDDLLLERPAGPWWNGLFSLVFTLAVVTGGVVWWPGVSRWRRSLRVNVASGWRRFNWDLHSALGFWLFPFMLMWGVSGWYLGMPDLLTDLVEHLPDGGQEFGERPGDVALTWLTRLHFGRWRDPVWGPWLKAVWAAIGLVPSVMAVTGLLMWWNRVVRRRRTERDVTVEAA